MRVRVTIILVIVAVGFLAGCKKGGNNTNPQQLLTQGSWFVHYFFDGNTDKTGSYAAYTFVFATSGSVAVTENATPVVTGAWQVTSADNANTLILQFGGASIIQQLTGNWKIVGTSGDLIEMEDDGTSPVHQLHFKKE